MDWWRKSSIKRTMPCHITDGPDYDDWVEQSYWESVDEDAAYEEAKQREIDRKADDGDHD